MKKLNKIIALSLFLLSSALCFAKTAIYDNETYSLIVNYNDTITPGDAVFARLKITPARKKGKSEVEKKASLELSQDKKVIENAPFYVINKKKSGIATEMLCGLPVSPWITGGTFSLKLTLTYEDNQIEFLLPVVFKNREFDKETIELDAKNTSIKTDNSPERAAQIEKLNNILFTTIPADVYTLKKFTPPNPSTRYTAHFGDRRIYAYSNGKSSTSLHYGNDYGIPTGSEVKACGDGMVVMAENRISTGWSVVIEHLPGLYSLYYHMSELNCKEGDMVHMGDLIGKSGATGLATGPHLHWEMRLNGSAVRPEFFLENFTFEEE